MSEVRIATAAVLRLLTYPLLASPLLMIPKLVSPRRVSDHLTVAFALVVVVFFATLAFFLIVTYAWWKRRDRSRLRFATPASDDAALVVTHPSEATAGAQVRARGRVVALGETLDGARLVVRAVTGDDGKPWRLVEAVPFAVVPRDGLPLVADVHAAPTVIGPTTGVSATEVAARFAADTVALADARDGGDYVEVAVGDEVELV